MAATAGAVSAVVEQHPALGAVVEPCPPGLVQLDQILVGGIEDGYRMVSPQLLLQCPQEALSVALSAPTSDCQLRLNLDPLVPVEN